MATKAKADAAVVTTSTPGYSHDEVLKRYHEQVPENRDFTAPRNESMFSLPGFIRSKLEKMLADPQDYICLELYVNVILLYVPIWFAVWSLPLWIPEDYLWVRHVAPWVMFVVFGLPPVSLWQKYILTLHVTSHKRLFPKGKYDWLNSVPEMLLNPFFGIPPGSYYLHHVVMHHRENNVFPRDMSSTMPYQRDSITGLLTYCLRYWTHQCLYLGYYAYKKSRFDLLTRYILSWTAFISLVYLSYQVNPLGTTHLCVGLFFLTGLLLMQGNFAQHMFIDPRRRFDNFGLAFNYVNHECNQKTFNDGYHIIHHMNSLLHWSKIPQWFEDHIEEFAVKDALIFNGIDTMQAWIFLVAGQWKSLHGAWVDLSPGPKRSVDEFRAVIEERLVPLDGDPLDEKQK